MSQERQLLSNSRKFSPILKIYFLALKTIYEVSAGETLRVVLLLYTEICSKLKDMPSGYS